MNCETEKTTPVITIALCIFSGLLIIANVWWFQAENIMLWDFGIAPATFYTLMSTIGLAVALLGGLMYIAPMYTENLAKLAMVLSLCTFPAGGGFALGMLAGFAAGFTGIFCGPSPPDIEDIEAFEEE